ncbi:hypothetical protein CYMTET_29867 [Cymbomonas tetramitiformis]|uniref:Uncharacterized protein n=1 Tax=Cymbomonas tetramitiformis TaxID=36881 RepID=A0AAE0FJY1_9CHLO|nr:hypothetical protein CYMTET_29867 [Cymbomonas tetramitiformis]
MGDKDVLFEGTELHVGTLFAKIVAALQACFLAEDHVFASLFTLDDSVMVVRVEANKLLFSTLKLIVKPRSPAVVATDMLGVRFPADTGPQDVIADFNAAALTAGDARTPWTMRSMASFVPEDVECDVLAGHFQLALDLRDCERFPAPRFVHGEPEMFSARRTALDAHLPPARTFIADLIGAAGWELAPGEPGMGFNYLPVGSGSVSESGGSASGGSVSLSDDGSVSDGCA